MRLKTNIQIVKELQPLHDKGEPIEFYTEADAKAYLATVEPGEYILVRVGKKVTVKDETVRKVRVA